VLLIVGALTNRKRKDDKDSEYYLESEEDERDKRKNGQVWKIITIIVGVLTPIVWLILDNLNQPMAWINKWTLYVGIVFIVHIAALIIYRVRRDKGQEDREYRYEDTPAQ
jgi:amino acid transporter